MKTTKLRYDMARGNLLTGAFLARAFARALRFRVFEKWFSEMITLDHLTRLIEGEVVIDTRSSDYERLVLDLPNAVVSIGLERRQGTAPSTTVEIFAASRQAATLELARLKELMPQSEHPVDERIQIGFWYLGPDGAAKVSRLLDAPAWEDARANYPVRTRQALQPLMEDAAGVIAGGRLILMHGAPGTGKTSALRTMARENRRTIQIEYVLDPEAMFGRDAGYFASVVFNETADDEEQVNKIRVLVLEDCDELLSADAKQRAGQGLARLLNLVDGMIGQGLQIGVLITTNEPLTAFHPAVTRPGRCGAVTAFDLFPADEAAGWLRAQGRAAPEDPGRMSLAELYAFGGEGYVDRETATRREPIGFVTSRRAPS